MFEKVFGEEYDPSKDEVISVRMPETMLKTLIELTTADDKTRDKLKEKHGSGALVQILMLCCINSVLKDGLVNGKREKKEPDIAKNELASKKKKMQEQIDQMNQNVKIMTDIMQRVSDL